MQPSDLYQQEHQSLREELRGLKNCQITFLTSSVTGTGLLLGLGTTFADEPLLGVVFLLPLTVLLPSWWIFFDKATTITRIVGYQRAIEALVLGHQTATGFVGWENALREFREFQNQGRHRGWRKPGKRFRSVYRLVFLLTTHRYWVICFYTFLLLSSICLGLSFYTLGTQWWVATVAGALLVLSAAIPNGVILWKLVYGHYSYDANEEFWKGILGLGPSGHP